MKEERKKKKCDCNPNNDYLKTKKIMTNFLPGIRLNVYICGYTLFIYV